MKKVIVLVLVACAVAPEAGAEKRVVDHLKELYRTFGQNSTTKVKVVSGPKDVKMRRGGVAGKQWLATCGRYRFKLTIQDSAKVKLTIDQLVQRIENLPMPYIKACQVVSDEKEDGIAVYETLGGAAAHGGKGYINIVPGANALVIAHEAGHTLEQAARESDSKILDRWEQAIKADKISVSKYGDHVRHEDLGDFAKAYAVCLDAGAKHLARLKALSPARFALWEEILKAPLPGKLAPAEALRRKLDPFYKKRVTAGGLLIVSSEKVSDYALKEVAYLVEKMLATRPDVLADLVGRNVYITVMAYNEMTTDMPETRRMSPWWDKRARGLGGNPVTCAEENVLSFRGDPYKGESIFLHEFAHGVHGALARVDKTFTERLKALYNEAKETGRFRGYGLTSFGEFFAEGVQSWLNCNRAGGLEVLDGKGKLLCRIHTRKQVREHMPELAAFLDEIFRKSAWTYVPVLQRLGQPHLKGYDPAKAPTFVWPQKVLEAFKRIEAERAQKRREADTRRKKKGK